MVEGEDKDRARSLTASAIASSGVVERDLAGSLLVLGSCLTLRLTAEPAATLCLCLSARSQCLGSGKASSTSYGPSHCAKSLAARVSCKRDLKRDLRSSLPASDKVDIAVTPRPRFLPHASADGRTSCNSLPPLCEEFGSSSVLQTRLEAGPSIGRVDENLVALLESPPPSPQACQRANGPSRCGNSG
jgi:hypothetical protein